MVELSVIRDLVTIFGVIAGFSYYVLTVRINQRNQELSLKAQQQQLETRQIQFYLQLYQRMNNVEAMRKWIEVMNMEWIDYDDFEKKYGTDFNPEAAATRLGTLYEWNGVGYLLRKGAIDRETLYYLQNNVAGIWLWSKFEPVIRELRVRYNMPEAFSELEYLANETAKEMEERGYSSKTPEGLTRYSGTETP